jgi:hypothetical protein
MLKSIYLVRREDVKEYSVFPATLVVEELKLIKDWQFGNCPLSKWNLYIGIPYSLRY